MADKSNNNISRGMRVLYNVSFMMVGNVASKFIMAVATLCMIRYLGSAEYGALSVALAFSSIMAYCADLGLTHTFIREGSKPNADIAGLLYQALRQRIRFALGTVLVVLVLVFVFYRNQQVALLIICMTIPAVIGASLQGFACAYFQLMEKMHLSATINALYSLITAVFLIFGVLLHSNLLMFSSIYGCSGLFVGLIAIVCVLKREKIVKSEDRSIMDKLLCFTVTGFLMIFLPQMGFIVLNRVADLYQVGCFSAAMRIPLILYLIPGTVASAFYPLIFKQMHDNNEKFCIVLAAMEQAMMLMLSVFVAIPFIFYPELMIKLLFGEKWLLANVIFSMRVLACIVIIQALHFPVADLLTTSNQQQKRMYVLLTASFVGVCLYYTLGKSYGAVGGAIAALFIDTLILVLCLIFYKNRFDLVKKNIAIYIWTFLFFLLSGYLTNWWLTGWIGCLSLPYIYLAGGFIIKKELVKEILRRFKF